MHQHRLQIRIDNHQEELMEEAGMDRGGIPMSQIQQQAELATKKVPLHPECLAFNPPALTRGFVLLKLLEKDLS
jgi:hypothetical protein